MSRRKMPTWTFFCPSKCHHDIKVLQKSLRITAGIYEWHRAASPSSYLYILWLFTTAGGLHVDGLITQSAAFFPRRGVSGHASRCMNHSHDNKSVVLIGWVARIEWGRAALDTSLFTVAVTCQSSALYTEHLPRAMHYSPLTVTVRHTPVSLAI